MSPARFITVFLTGAVVISVLIIALAALAGCASPGRPTNERLWKQLNIEETE